MMATALITITRRLLGPFFGSAIAQRSSDVARCSVSPAHVLDTLTLGVLWVHSCNQGIWRLSTFPQSRVTAVAQEQKEVKEENQAVPGGSPRS